MKSKYKVILLGYVVRGPIGGMSWHHLNYFLGLKKLGHDVFYIEDSGDLEDCCYDPVKEKMSNDPAYGLNYASEVFKQLGLENQWCYFDKHTNTWYGKDEIHIRKIAEADILINVSMINQIRDWFKNIPIKIVIDTDPVFTQIRNLIEPARKNLCESHNRFFSFGENFGKENCIIPDDKFPWKPTRQPIFLDAWNVNNEIPSGKWSTIMQWHSYKDREYNGQVFGMKSISFEKIIDVPNKIPGEKFQLVIGKSPIERLQSHGWEVIDFFEPSKSPWSYQNFIGNSKGEFTVVKHGYEVSNSGWFSERSLCYLAKGKPVITQDSGFSQFISSGKGLMVYTTEEEAIFCVKEVNSDYSGHCKSARNIAEEFFNSDLVLSDLLNRI